MIPKVVQVLPGDGYEVYVYFEDGAIKLFDMSAIVNKGGVFKNIADSEVFRESMTVLNDTLAWDIDGNRNPYDCIDIDPIHIYESGINAEDPLAEAV